MITEVRTITPEDAAELLNRNVGNRPPKGGAIKRYAADMRAGRWILNGEAIILRKDGTMLNGQNRLMACIRARTPFTTLVVSDVSDEAMDTIDIGMGRTLADQLHWRGITTNAPTIAAAVKWMHRYDRMVAEKRKQFAMESIPREEELAYFDKYRALIEGSTAAILPLRRRIPGPQSIPLFVHFLLSRYKGSDVADDFYNQVAYESADDSPAKKLKDWLLDRGTVMARPSPIMVAAIHVKAARFWMAGAAPSKLMWKRTSKTLGERFPRIDDPAGFREDKPKKGKQADSVSEALAKLGL